MSDPQIPGNAKCTSQNDIPKSSIETSGTILVDRLKQSNLKLTTENRLIRTVIKELEIANMKAGVEKKLTKNRIGIFETIDAEDYINYSDAQKQMIDTWLPLITKMVEMKRSFDVKGAEKERESYEAAIESWQSLFTRRDDIEIMMCIRVVSQRISKDSGISAATITKLNSEVTRLKSEINELKSDIIGHKKRLKVQNKVVSGLQKREKVSEAEMKSNYEKMLKQQSNILNEKEKTSVAEIKSSYEKKLKEQTENIASIEQREKTSAAEMKNRYEKELKVKNNFIASLSAKQKISAAEMKSGYETKLKEQSSTITDLEEERATLKTEMKVLRRELNAHREVSISILGRKRELMKPFESRNDHVIETGNLSAHHGTCLADVFRIKSNTDVDDSPWFKEHYGVAVDTVEKFGGSAAFAKLVNMRYDMHSSNAEDRAIASEFESGFQDILAGILKSDLEAVPESIDGFLLKNKKAKETFQRLCSIWDTTRASQRKRFQESRDPKRRSILGGSMRSSASVWTGETQRRSKLDKIEEYGKDILASAKDAMLWTKH
ncbi:hypothetical protein SBOR_3639 [Sclerotinia borealis F-4128]|uniref:Uncharacterized protein n=1 Tax=Sclerotinia borealis (strain F-4128) TaxID=1432307 RepID=W9CGV3_SCLBF|nr:hypothetical protein SBOR_3639 [Sclerotinia borealis F-4128]